MRVLESLADELSPTTWDEMVASVPEGHLLQTWAWGELKGAFGWIPIRLAVERDGMLVAGAQVLYRKVGPLSIGYVPKGPVFLDHDPQVAALLWQALHRQSRRARAILLKVEPEWRDEDERRHAWLRQHGLAPSSECV